MAVLAVVGILVGTQINRGIYRLAWFHRLIGPWSPPHPDAPPRGPGDGVPVIGWWFLRRESPIHGRGFWIRPMLLELAMGVGFAALYWYEIEQQGVFAHGRTVFVPLALRTPLVLHLQLLSHLVLISLMMVATFIDFDEQTIPDTITVPGTLLGLVFATVLPQSRALVAVPAALAGGGFAAEHLHLASGTGRPGISDWPPWLNGPVGLVIGLACCLTWCVAIIPWTWTLRRGWGMAFRFWVASLTRRPVVVPIAITGFITSLVIIGIWWLGGTRWESLLSALVGMAVGGGTVWAVRVVGSAALGQEAMGFGDVTLMAMIGSFTGWQPTLIIFFLAPFSAIVIAVSQYVLTRRHDIAFGPYLCLGALFWMLHSGTLWRDYGLPIFSMGWLVPAIAGSGLLLMGGMLQFWRLVRDRLFPWEPEESPSPTPPQHRDGAQTQLVSFSRMASCQHPLRRQINLQPPPSPIPAPRNIGDRPPNSQLFRR
jgi:prepilin signal peptidase PulO-like enzyme (type II secretory pathway)